MLIDAGSVDDFTHAKIRTIEIEGRGVGLVRWNGKFYAFRNLCPHQRGPLAEGEIRVRLVCSGPIGGLDTDEASAVIACPWHRWRFDLDTGRSVWDPTGPRIVTYRTIIQNGRVMIETKPA